MPEEEQTCGKGLAENAALPAKLGELTAAIAGVLEAHMKALDLADENSRTEHEAYARLAREHRETAAQLEATAREMAGYRDLPMGRHDVEALAGPEPLAAFERFLEVKRELVRCYMRRYRRTRRCWEGRQLPAKTVYRARTAKIE